MWYVKICRVLCCVLFVVCVCVFAVSCTKNARTMELSPTLQNTQKVK